MLRATPLWVRVPPEAHHTKKRDILSLFFVCVPSDGWDSNHPYCKTELCSQSLTKTKDYDKILAANLGVDFIVPCRPSNEVVFDLRGRRVENVQVVDNKLVIDLEPSKTIRVSLGFDSVQKGRPIVLVELNGKPIWST